MTRWFLPFLWTIALLPSLGWAARPMIVDDARIVDPKACQAESWMRGNPDGTREFWSLPACNPLGNFEFTLGGARTANQGVAQTTDAVVQIKAITQPLSADKAGIGFALGNVRLPQEGKRDFYGYLMHTRFFAGERGLLHLNLGASYDGVASREHLTYGIGTEWQISPKTWLIAEVFGQSGLTRFAQVGVRHWLILNHVQIDTTYADRVGGPFGDRWFTIGLRLISKPFLP